MMNAKEPPSFDRARPLRDDEARRQMRTLLRQAARLLEPDERLGEPFREGDCLVIPVERAEDAVDDALSLHALVAAWLDEPTL